MRFLRRLSYFLFIFSIFVVLFTTFAHAATPTPDPCAQTTGTSTTPAEEPEAADFGDSDAEFTTDPSPECIDETTQNIEVTFHGLSVEGKGYVLCTGDTACLKEEGFVKGINGPDDVFKSGLPSADSTTGDVTIKVCGDGSSKMKIGDDCPDNSKKNYFWGGNMYFFSIGTLVKDYYRPLKRGGFYVQRAYPEVKIDPNTGLAIDPKVAKSISVTVYGVERPGGTNRNNYQITMVGGETLYDREDCVNIGEGTRFSDIRTIGKYLIRIKDRVNEPKSAGNILKQLGGDALFTFINPIGQIKTAIDLRDNIRRKANDCQGGFTYYQITCEFTNPNKGGGKCTDPKIGKDPKGEEYKAFMKDLAELNKARVMKNLPCGDGKVNTTSCLEINTAIGPINVSSFEGFVTTIFTFVLTIATFGGIIIIIYAGYVFMTSGGNKEKIAAARETLTSAIVGLLFIILSIVILEIIGVDILRIPGFGR